MNKTILFAALLSTLLFTACSSKKEEKLEEGKYTITNPLLMDTSFHFIYKMLDLNYI